MALLNDNDFLGMKVNTNLVNHVEQIIARDIRNIVTKPEKPYPFYPDLRVSQPCHN